jgi:aconitate hydratase 2/2-methylisocitrate dehydratase
MADMGVLTTASDKIYQYLNFDKMPDFTDVTEAADKAAVKATATA